jgi:Smg protein
MIEVLVYLFEQYYHASAYPDHDTLARKLSAAGFGSDDISEALDWLQGLADREQSDFPTTFEQGRSFRTYTPIELEKLAPESRGFLSFLEAAGVLSPTTRELVIERAMAVTDDAVELQKLKIIVLIVLWTQHGSVDAIVLDELLPDGEPRILH